MIFNPEYEAMDPEVRRQLQFARLKNLVEKLYRQVPFYRKKMDEAGIQPRHITCLEDIKKLPFTTKDDLRETYPYGLLACPEAEIEEIHMSSGTTGLPVVDAYTRRDVENWEEAMARTLAGAGATRNDVIQNCYGYGLFTGGLGVHYGAKRLGANIIPMSSGNTQKQLMVMRDFGSTILTCTPSYALYMAEEAAETGYDLKKMKLRAGCFGAEPWSENMRREIEAKYGIDAYDIYGLTEITGPGVAFECEAKDGLHINEDLFYPEIIDPDTGEVLPEGEKGELVFTTLVKEGTPLLRYRTRDVTFLRRDRCVCGRTTIKMNRLFGRTDDMLIIRGVNVFPSQIEHALIEIEGTDPHYLIIVDRGPSHLDEVELQVEVKKELFGDETRQLENLRTKIENVMKSKLGISLKVKLVEPKTIERSIGKAKRVIDKRKI
ncbi:MAG TPA: phenylacetate--CoA ligase [Termitinemataceae bacterium]|uniref:phenylacetate--CoA ligase family protein n=1 Tax=Treponema sp. J25 TaxID=2094121 RepID=UPI001052E388|nr:phenylacetate--CoA ligase [Treponema sp. J25]TCW60865.1 phenylacetate--CoA ligase [Treponema sp. J25]HOJ99677.1 phenylacetate--CoA ligase [Termitinemataceae bacterium]HOM23810.1 phenylacetate--CoA ligase [Termitinemataceae bacterium]HPQ00887.1 phenylacetate--CoA ligase [Termitinemataceae bacterium]